MYDEPEFVIRNIWRLYGGWWDGNPANLKPARDGALAAEVAALAAPDDTRVHQIRAEAFQTRREQETSLMAKGIFGFAANQSTAKAG